MAYEHSLEPPSAQFPFGTDEFGRDLLIRTLAGLRLSLTIAAGAVLFAVFVGVPLGMISGYYRGYLEVAIMRTIDVLLAFPPILIALAIVAFWGSGPIKLALVIGLAQAPRFARLAYSSTLSQSQQDYVTAAQALGGTSPRIFTYHLIPNISAPIIVEMSLGVGTAVLTEAGLSYLGLGSPPPTPALGLMISMATGYMSFAPWMLLAPSIMLSATIIGLNLFGDALRDKIDPRTA
jgi:peptide/nickel transport system permease protein